MFHLFSSPRETRANRPSFPLAQKPQEMRKNYYKFFNSFIILSLPTLVHCSPAVFLYEKD